MVCRRWKRFMKWYPFTLTHWGPVTHICVSDLTNIGSGNGLSPGRRQAIIWTNAGILLIGPLRTNFSEILIEIHAFSFTIIHLKMLSAKWRPFCLGLSELRSPRPCQATLNLIMNPEGSHPFASHRAVSKSTAASSYKAVTRRSRTRHRMMTSLNGNIFRVSGPLCGEFTGEFPSQRPVTRSFDVFFGLRLNKRLSKHSIRRWFETPWRSLWRHCNAKSVFSP